MAVSYPSDSVLFYSIYSEQVMTASETVDKVGVNPLTAPALSMYAGVYPLNFTDNPHDEDFYVVTLEYNIVNDEAVPVWSKTDKPLNDAKEAAYKRLKVDYEQQSQAIIGDWGVLTLIAIAAKTSTPKTNEELDVITDLKVLSDQLAADIDVVQAATDVDTINTFMNG